MSKRPQFSLKALFVIMAVLAVPLGMMGSGHDTLVLVGKRLQATRENNENASK